MARPQLSPWRETARFSEIARGPVERRISPDGPQIFALSKQLGLDALESLIAHVTVSPWLDGAELRGRFTAEVVQTCGVTLEPLEQTLTRDFDLRVLPAGSPNLPAEDAVVDPEADDPPDAIEGDEIDIAHYVVEHLALEIDPFPRKPGAVFEPPTPEEEASPFAVLKRLQRDETPE